MRVDDAPVPDRRRRPSTSAQTTPRSATATRSSHEVIVRHRPGSGPSAPTCEAVWAADYWEATHPYSAGGAYINFMMDEGQDRVRATYRSELRPAAQKSRRNTTQTTCFVSTRTSARPKWPSTPSPPPLARMMLVRGVSQRWEAKLCSECSNIIGAQGMSVHARRVIGAVPDLLVVPGGGWAAKAPMGSWAEVRRGVLPVAIAQRYAAGSQVAGVCTGAMLLATSGMLRGRPAVTHRCALDDLRKAGADVRAEARVVDDGDVLTCGGVTSAIDLALHIVKREKGEDVAAHQAHRLECDFKIR